VEEYQKSYVCYASRGYLCEPSNLSTIRAHGPNYAPITVRLDIARAPAEYCLPVKKDRRFSPELTIQVRSCSFQAESTPVACFALALRACTMLADWKLRSILRMQQRKKKL
jgi:hypothetical protein